MQPPPQVIGEFMWQPIAELPAGEVFAFGRPWNDVALALRLPVVATLGFGDTGYGCHVPSRAVRVYALPSGQRLVVERRQRRTTQHRGDRTATGDACRTHQTDIRPVINPRPTAVQRRTPVHPAVPTHHRVLALPARSPRLPHGSACRDTRWCCWHGPGRDRGACSSRYAGCGAVALHEPMNGSMSCRRSVLVP